MQRIRSATATIEVISDEEALACSLAALLGDEATTVETHDSFASLHAVLASSAPDVVIVDDHRSDDAAQQIRLLRRRQPSIYIVYVNVANEKRSIDLLDCGADDVVIESSPTLLPRLQSATRRARTLNAGTRIAVGDIVFDRESHRVWCAGQQVSLTPLEYGVVDCLFWHAPAPVGVDTLADFVWGDQQSSDKRTLVQVYVSYVRRKLAKSARVAIRYSKGSGYRFSPLADESPEASA